MRPAVAIEADPVANNTAGMLQCFEAMPMSALLLQGPDDAFDHAILLRALRRDELLLQSVTPHQSDVTATGEHQAVIRAQQERRCHRHSES